MLSIRSSFDMQGLLDSLEIGKPFPVAILDDTSVTTILTSHTVLVNGIPVKSGKYCEEGSAKYIVKLGILEYTLSGVESEVDVSVSIRDNEINGMFSLSKIDLKEAYLYLKVLEANLYRFPYYRDVVRTYIYIFFGRLIRTHTRNLDHQVQLKKVLILVTDNFYLTYHYGLGLTISSLFGDFVLGHLLQDMRPGGAAIFHYIYKYVEEVGTAPNVKSHSKGFEHQLLKDFAISQHNFRWKYGNYAERKVSIDQFHNELSTTSDLHSYVVDKLRNELDDNGVVYSLVQLLSQAIDFNKQKNS